MVFHANWLSARAGKNSVSVVSRNLCVSSRTNYNAGFMRDMGLPSRRLGFFYFFVIYSQLSANGNSRTRTALLTDTVFNFPRVSAFVRVDCILFFYIYIF